MRSSNEANEGAAVEACGVTRRHERTGRATVVSDGLDDVPRRKVVGAEVRRASGVVKAGIVMMGKTGKMWKAEDVN